VAQVILPAELVWRINEAHVDGGRASKAGYPN